VGDLYTVTLGAARCARGVGPNDMVNIAARAAATAILRCRTSAVIGLLMPSLYHCAISVSG